MGKLGHGSSASGAGAEGSRWSCSFMDPAPWDLAVAIPWDQGCGRAAGEGYQGQRCSSGLPLSPSWDRIGIWKGCGAPALLHTWHWWEVQCRCFTALGQAWHLLLLLPDEPPHPGGSSSSSSSCQASFSTSPSLASCSSLAFSRWHWNFSSAFPRVGLGNPGCPLPCPGHSHDIPGFEILRLRSRLPTCGLGLSNWSLDLQTGAWHPQGLALKAHSPGTSFPPKLRDFLFFIAVSQGGAGGACRSPVLAQPAELALVSSRGSVGL